MKNPYVIDYCYRIYPNGGKIVFEIHKKAKNGQTYLVAECKSENAAKTIIKALNK